MVTVNRFKKYLNLTQSFSVRASSPNKQAKPNLTLKTQIIFLKKFKTLNKPVCLWACPQSGPAKIWLEA
jgi:hypothetical protein